MTSIHRLHQSWTRHQERATTNLAILFMDKTDQYDQLVCQKEKKTYLYTARLAVGII